MPNNVKDETLAPSKLLKQGLTMLRARADER